VSAGDELGVVAAGHPLSARAGADVLRDGGNAVDGALAAMLASFACEPLLTGLGAGGYMLVVIPGQRPVLLDFFVAAPGRSPGHGPRADLLPIRISFGDAMQVFNIGVASAGCYGMPAGICEASRRFGRLALERLVAPAAALARDGVQLTAGQAYIVELLGAIVTSTPECAALFAPRGALLRAGDRMFQPELAEAMQRLGQEGSRPFYEGDIGAAITDWLAQRGGLLRREDLAAYEVIDREPIRVSYRGREVLTNPPPSPGGLLIARALAMLTQTGGPPAVTDIAAVIEQTQRARTPAFLAGLEDPAFVRRFLSGEDRGGASGAGGGGDAGRPSRLGSTTHISVLDAEGAACSVTCSNGSASGVVVPGTGVHLNNMLGEQDLNPGGFHRHPPGDRMPSMMSPTVVLADGTPVFAVGSAGSNRIRSAILQTVVRSIDEGLSASEAVNAPRLHWEDGLVYTEPGIDRDALAAAGYELSPFREPNLFFGGVQAAARDAAGGFSGGGDPRRGGASIVVPRS